MSNSAREGWLRSALDGTAARPVGGREHALCCSGHGDGAAACKGKRTATRRLRVAWAVLDGTESWCWLPLAATGGSATAEVAGVGEARCHRHLLPSKRAWGALDKEGEQGARIQGGYWRDRRRVLTKRHCRLNPDTESLNFSESRQKQCMPGVR